MKLTYWETDKAAAETHASLARNGEGRVIAQKREEPHREGAYAKAGQDTLIANTCLPVSAAR